MFATFFVTPVGCNAILRILVHLGCSDLHFQWTLVVIDHSRMQGLIKVILGRGDVIIKLTRDRTPVCVDDSKCSVTGWNIWNDEPDSPYVPNQFERFPFFHHRLIYGVNVLWSTCDRSLDVIIFP